jgi:hypothetical protein
MIDLDGWIAADGARLPDAWVGGLSDTDTVVGFGETYGCVSSRTGTRASTRSKAFCSPVWPPVPSPIRRSHGAGRGCNRRPG